MANAKLAVVTTLHRWKSEKELRLVPSVDLKTPKNSSLFFCLTALMREFVSNGYDYGYLTMEKETDCLRFDHCIKTIQQADNPDNPDLLRPGAGRE